MACGVLGRIKRTAVPLIRIEWIWVFSCSKLHYGELRVELGRGPDLGLPAASSYLIPVMFMLFNMLMLRVGVAGGRRLGLQSTLA